MPTVETFLLRSQDAKRTLSKMGTPILWAKMMIASTDGGDLVRGTKSPKGFCWLLYCALHSIFITEASFRQYRVFNKQAMCYLYNYTESNRSLSRFFQLRIGLYEAIDIAKVTLYTKNCLKHNFATV